MSSSLIFYLECVRAKGRLSGCKRVRVGLKNDSRFWCVQAEARDKHGRQREERKMSFHHKIDENGGGSRAGKKGKSKHKDKRRAPASIER